MDRRFAYLVFLGAIIGGLGGLAYGSATEQIRLGIAFGITGGAYLGWFAAMIATQRHHRGDR